MYRIIGGDGREYGPVTGDTVRQWVMQNRANAKTLVRPDNSSDWRPLAEMPEFASSFGAPPPQPPPYSAAGPAPSSAPTPETAQPAFAEDLARLNETLVARDYRLDIGQCIGDAFNLLGRKFWMLVGGFFLMMVCSTVVSMIIPVVGGIINLLLLSQVFNGGLYFFYMKLIRDEPVSIGDTFSGFSRSFSQLMLLSLVSSILMGIISAPMVVPIIGAALWNWDPVTMGLLAFVFCIPVIYISVAWLFSSMLVIDRGYEFWDAMELSRRVVGKHWFTVFLLAIVAGIIGAVGMILFFVGFLVTMPVGIASIVYAYETMFPRVGPNESPKSQTAPTTPAGPAEPAGPESPATPEEPGTPETPSEPTNPTAPSDPQNPQP